MVLISEGQHATGNVPKSAPLPCLELMMEHWAPNSGMQSTSLCDGSTAHEDVDSDSVSFSDNTAASNHNKRKRTNGECVKEGFRALADGVKVMGEIMKSKSSTASDSALFRDVVASLSRQENALNLQTAAIKEWIQTLRNKD